MAAFFFSPLLGIGERSTRKGRWSKSAALQSGIAAKEPILSAEGAAS